MFNFNEKFRTFGTIDLLRMLEHPEKYQPEAIAATKEILEDRKKEHPEEWQNAVEKLETENKLNALSKTDALDASPVAEDVYNIWIEDDVSLKNRKLAWNQVLVICGVLAIVLSKDLYYTLSAIFRSEQMVHRFFRTDPILIALYLSGITTIIFLLKKDKIGWILLVSQCIYTTMSSILLIGMYLNKSYNTNDFSFPISFYNVVLPLVVYSAILRQALSRKIMKLYNGNIKLFWITGVIVVFLYLCYVIGLARGGH